MVSAAISFLFDFFMQDYYSLLYQSAYVTIFNLLSLSTEQKVS